MENINRSTLQLVAKQVPVAFIGNLKRWNVHTTHSLLKLHGSFFFAFWVKAIKKHWNWAPWRPGDWDAYVT